MDPQRHKWTIEEVEALKAGVTKHGIGKWRAILTDPEFRHALESRSNVDLKDKWRNLCRKTSVLELWHGANPQSTAKKESISMSLGITPQEDENVMSLGVSGGSLQISNLEEEMARENSPRLPHPEKENMLTDSQVNVEMADVTNMSIQEAIVAAISAIVDAETAAAKAEEAVMEAEIAQAEAEASESFAKATIMAVNEAFSSKS